ncbi:DUF2946 family protein [Rhodoligotrophos appendicifer]|uniref:DUF2946 family protein n=1 Tax=Rhodoligotrophos appendicifer TaxID=987056 RepID=UPI003D16A8DF
MIRERTSRSSWLALLAGYMLVIQLVFSGYASALLAGDQQEDHHSLCTPGGIASLSDRTSSGAKHHAVPDCCSASCGMFAAADVPESAGVELYRRSTVLPAPRAVASARKHSSLYERHQSRAPPRSERTT